METPFSGSSPLYQSLQQTNSSHLVIGYYNLRGKAQVCRLLCEYLGVQYQDKLFTLSEWQRACSQRIKEWPLASLPFVREGNFVVTESVPMCVYVINRFGNQELLGKNLRDRGIVQMYIWTIEYMGNVITINCQQKSVDQLRRFKEAQWNEKVLPRLIKLEQAANEGGWFLGYLTIIDFSIYELVRYMECIFENLIGALPKLKKIEKAVGEIRQIKQYEISQRAILEWCPTKLLAGLNTSTKTSGN